MTMLHALLQNQGSPSLVGEILNPAYLTSRLNTLAGAGTPVDKIRAVVGSIGARFRAPAPSGTQTQARFSVPVWTAYQSTNLAYTSPAGYTVRQAPVQFA